MRACVRACERPPGDRQTDRQIGRAGGWLTESSSVHGQIHRRVGGAGQYSYMRGGVKLFGGRGKNCLAEHIID
jgi:hypothetical protein